MFSFLQAAEGRCEEFYSSVPANSNSYWQNTKKHIKPSYLSTALFCIKKPLLNLSPDKMVLSQLLICMQSEHKSIEIMTIMLYDRNIIVFNNDFQHIVAVNDSISFIHSLIYLVDSLLHYLKCV